MPTGPTVLVADDPANNANPATVPTLGDGAAFQTVNFSPTYTLPDGTKIPWLLIVGLIAAIFFLNRKGGLKL